MLDHYFPQQDLSLFQRMLLIWAFMLSAVVLSFKAAQSYAEPRPQWTVMTNQNKPFWYTYYVFVAFMLMQVSYGPLRWNLEGRLPGGLEVHILDALWIGLLALEAGMLVWVFTLRIARSFKGQQKVKEL